MIKVHIETSRRALLKTNQCSTWYAFDIVTFCIVTCVGVLLETRQVGYEASVSHDNSTVVVELVIVT